MENIIPRPDQDSDSEPFWTGLKKNKLFIQQCEHCGEYIFYPRLICPYCFSERVMWVKATGNGQIYSYTVVHRAFGAFKDQTPFIIGIVELDEGVRMMTRILGNQNQVKIGKSVSIFYKKIDSNLTLPYFQIT